MFQHNAHTVNLPINAWGVNFLKGPSGGVYWIGGVYLRGAFIGGGRLLEGAGVFNFNNHSHDSFGIK